MPPNIDWEAIKRSWSVESIAEITFDCVNELDEYLAQSKAEWKCKDAQIGGWNIFEANRSDVVLLRGDVVNAEFPAYIVPSKDKLSQFYSNTSSANRNLAFENVLAKDMPFFASSLWGLLATEGPRPSYVEMISFADKWVSQEYRSGRAEFSFSDPDVCRCIVALLGEAVRESIGEDLNWSFKTMPQFDVENEIFYEMILAGLRVRRKFLKISWLTIKQLGDPDVYSKDRLISGLFKGLIAKAERALD